MLIHYRNFSHAFLIKKVNMKYLLVTILFVVSTLGLSAQNTPQNKPDLDDVMKEFQMIMDSIDLNSIFNEELLTEWNEALSDSVLNFEFFNIDSIFRNLNFEDLNFGDLDLKELKLNELDFEFPEAEEMNKMMQESLKIFEDFDFSQMQKMLDGMEFNFRDLNITPIDSLQSGSRQLKKI